MNNKLKNIANELYKSCLCNSFVKNNEDTVLYFTCTEGTIILSDNSDKIVETISIEQDGEKVYINMLVDLMRYLDISAIKIRNELITAETLNKMIQ